MIPTTEQAEIISFGKDSQKSLLVNALAGAAKTSTLVMLAHALPLQPILCLAFNKRIADEMQKRMPSHVQCLTLNGLGHRTWAKTTGRRLVVDTSKTHGLVKAEIEALKGDEKREAYAVMSSILKGVGIAKLSGFVPAHFTSVASPILTDLDELGELIAPSIDDDLNWSHLELISRVVSKSLELAYAGNIDFDDQIYMPTLFGGQFPRYPTVMVDEAQDLSPLNHKMLEVMKPGRLIAVGDPWQSIYAFRGADRHSMAKLKKTFDMDERTLSISFRCPISAVKRAHFRVPHMKWWETAIEGEIVRLDNWSATDVPDGSFILCRNNAPLFSCALRLIRAGRGVHLVGRELGPSLIKVLKKLGPVSMLRENVLVAIKAWEVEALAKARESRRASIVDRAECLRVFAEYGNTLDEAISYAEHIFSSDGPVKLMSVHKAKGLENDDVFHLDAWRIPSKYARSAAENGDHSAMDQELNIRYVAETRHRKRLFLADLEKMQ